MELFKQHFLNVITKKYLAFDGKADRPEFWYFTLFSFIFSIVFSFLGPLVFVYYLAVLCPSIAVAARRLRDAGFSPWWLLCSLFFGFGGIVPFIMCMLPSKETAAN